MGKKFNYLNVPSHWKHYWTKYPEGYTILEALLNWVAQVDKMVDNINDWNEYLDDFVATFDENLQGKVVSTLREWQDSGFLDVVIDEALWTEMHILEQETQEKLNQFSAELAQKATKHWVDVTNFGAIGDGLNDDTSAILEAVSTLGNGGVLYFPNKEYIINAEIDLPSNTTVIGEKSSIKSSLLSNECLFRIDGKENVSIENIRISLINSGTGIGVVNSDNIVIKGVEIIGGGAQQGITIEHTNQLIVDNCYVDGVRGSHGIALYYSKNIDIVNNVIKNTRRAAVSINRGCKNINVDNNICDFNQQDFEEDGAIDIYGYVPECENVKITNNIVTNTGKDGNGNCGIRIKDAINVTVEGNFIRVDNPLLAPIYLQGRDAENNAVLKDISIVNNRIIINEQSQYVFRTAKPFDPPLTDISFEGNYIESKRSDVGGFEIRYSIENFKFKNNIIRMPNRDGNIIFLYPTGNLNYRKNVEISGNDVIFASGQFVRSHECDGLIISNNIVKTESTVSVIRIDETNDNVMILGNHITSKGNIVSISEDINFVMDNNMEIKVEQ